MAIPSEGKFSANPYCRQRRSTREVRVGDVGVGGANPIRVQSMLTCDTLDTEQCIAQTLALVEAGCEIVRITAQTVRHAANLEHIKRGLLDRGCNVPLVADIHFKPEAALEAAQWVEKVRINPGNYADSKKFAVREYSDSEYAAEIDRIAQRFVPLVEYCRDHAVALRIGTNHGSLSDRIMNRYGDTPLGMVESALEFARIARDCNFHHFVFSMKASNPKVAIEAYRLLVAKLDLLGSDWNYPVHLGVTEAGDGEDGRIKSAIGIGALLSDGIGDTIRVSLTEDSVHEIPVAQALVAPYNHPPQVVAEPWIALPKFPPLAFNPFEFQRRASQSVEFHQGEQRVVLGGEEPIRVVTTRDAWKQLQPYRARLGDCQPELIFEDLKVVALDPRDNAKVADLNARREPQLVTVADGCDLPIIAAFRLLAGLLPAHHPILLKDTLDASLQAEGLLESLLESSKVFGSLLCDGIGDAILLRGEKAPVQAIRTSYNILQAAGTRIFKTDYVACPSCGRTLFDLQSTTARIRAATEHLKGVRIAVMGCIVNGPGEMADADFGYVGGAPGKINLYVGKEAVAFNIPEELAVERLIDLIKEHGKWAAPAEGASLAEIS